LHLGVIQSTSIGKDRQRITRERRLREYIELNELVGSVRHKKTSQCVPENGQDE
jgi:hypothetical protein